MYPFPYEAVPHRFDHINHSECPAIKIKSFCYDKSNLPNTYINITSSLADMKSYAKKPPNISTYNYVLTCNKINLTGVLRALKDKW